MDDETELATARERYDEYLSLVESVFEEWVNVTGASVAEWITEQTKAHVTGEPDHSQEMGRDRVQELRRTAEATSERSIEATARTLAGCTPEALATRSRSDYLKRTHDASDAAFSKAGTELAAVLKDYGFASSYWSGWNWYVGTTKQTGGSIHLPPAVIGGWQRYLAALDALANASQAVNKIVDRQKRDRASDLWE